MKKFIEAIKLTKSLKDINMPEGEIEALAKQCMVLPDYKGNPRVVTKDEMIDLISSFFE